jgi:hypothetical protein
MIDDDRFEKLWSDYLEGDLDEAGRGELQRLLAAEPRMQRAVDAYQIHRLLGMLATEAALQAGAPRVQADAGRSAADAFVADTMARLPADDESFAGDVMSRIGGMSPLAVQAAPESCGRWPRWAQAATAAVIIGGLAAVAVVSLWQRDGGIGPGGPAPRVADAPAPAHREGTDRGDAAAIETPFATVTHKKFLLSADADHPLVVGQPLEPGHVKILGGAVEMTLRNGVTIVLEGPGDLELRGELAAFLHAGNVVVRMPEGMKGFRLDTATTDVLDLGTEFAVKAGAGFVTDVQVYEGAVIASGKSPEAAGRFPKRLEAGQAARFSPLAAAEPESLPFAESRFVRRLLPDVGIPHRAPDTRDATARADDLRQYGRAEQAAITVTRAVEPVTIDGRLDDWQAAAGFTTTRDGSTDCPEWADGRMMYDDEHLYIAAHVGDPAPMRSTIDPELDADDGWRGGGVQVRLSTDRAMGWPVNANTPNYFAMRGIAPTPEQKAAATNPRLAHLTMWFHAPSRTVCLTIAHGMLVSDLAVNPSGFRGGYTRDADGKGYVLEYAIPWRLLHCESNRPRPGDTLAAAWQVHWSDEGGRLWRDQLIEVRNPDEPQRILIWERGATWGRAEYR